MTFDIIIAVATAAGVWVWAIADYRAAVRARAAHRRKFLRCEMAARRRALMKELRRDAARARAREERTVAYDRNKNYRLRGGEANGHDCYTSCK